MLDALYLQFFVRTYYLFKWGNIYIKWRRSLSADVNNFSVFMRININFVTTVGLKNDERCLIQNLRVYKHWGSEKNYEMFSNKWAHLHCVPFWLILHMFAKKNKTFIMMTLAYRSWQHLRWNYKISTVK